MADRSDTRTPELHLVANRLPVSWAPGEGWHRAPGGLVTALDALVRRGRIGWFGSAAAVGGDGHLPTWSHGPLFQVDIAPDVADRAIGGMANSTLWPALHGMSERVRWNDHWWDDYVTYNEQFADAVAARVPLEATVWVHDFHLLLLPAALTVRRPDLTIGLSIHTPFDDRAVGELPVADELRSALRAPHLIGMQTPGDRQAMAALLGETTLSRIVVSPVSIDPEALGASASAPVADLLLDRLGVARADRTLIVGVDRMDYTKGITERLMALDRVFRHRLVDPEAVDVVQIAQPSRTDLSSYRHLGLEAERLAHQVGADWARRDGTPPVRLLSESVDRRLVAALLASADIALVTPVRDGMNLVAKEFSILNEAHGGVLVLGRGAGAAGELGDGSVLVDGGDPASVADGLLEALALDEPTRRAWAARRARRVRAWTADSWSNDFRARLMARAGSAGTVSPSAAMGTRAP